MAESLLDIFCALFGCAQSQLSTKFCTIEYDELLRIGTLLKRDYYLVTIHLGENNKLIRCDDISFVGANTLWAYQGFLNITVQQHMYSKHKITLKYPKMPCIVENAPNNHKSYYPIELIHGLKKC